VARRAKRKRRVEEEQASICGSDKTEKSEYSLELLNARKEWSGIIHFSRQFY